MRQRRLSWLLPLLVLAGAGCSGATQNTTEESKIVTPKLPGSSVMSPTGGVITDTTGGTGPGGTGTGGTSGNDATEENPALVVHIINTVLN